MSTAHHTDATDNGHAAIAGRALLVTGANRGLGRALVQEALHRGAERVYAASRRPFTHSDPRVTPIILDVTDETAVQHAPSECSHSTS